jgi:hypothetical protein
MNISSGTSVLDSSPRIAILMSGFFLVILAEHIAHCAPGEDYQGVFQKSIGAARRVLVPRAAVPALQIYKAKLQIAATGVQGDWVFALYTGGLFMTTNRPSRQAGAKENSNKGNWEKKRKGAKKKPQVNSFS